MRQMLDEDGDEMTTDESPFLPGQPVTQLGKSGHVLDCYPTDLGCAILVEWADGSVTREHEDGLDV